jgi:hypothetical protein
MPEKESTMNNIIKLASGRNLLILLLLFLLANLVAIPFFYPKFQTLDTLTSYTPEKAYNLISSYGDQGRQSYVMIELTLDLIYPLISALLFSSAIIYAFRHGFPDFAWTGQLALIPFGVMLADYFENVCIIFMLLIYPQKMPIVAGISNVFTVTKLALSPFELIFLVGLAGWLVRRIRIGFKSDIHACH